MSRKILIVARCPIIAPAGRAKHACDVQPFEPQKRKNPLARV